MNSFSHIAGVAVGLSFLCALALIATRHIHGRFTYDAMTGVQKVHKSLTPRIGGISILLALAVSLFLLPVEMEARRLGLFLLAASLPTFATGLWEDITKTVSPLARLCSHVLSATILVLVGGFVLRHTGFVATDPVMTITPIAVFISILAVSGMTNAVNIIDGFNGLASGTVIIMSAGIALLAMRLGDIPVFIFALLLSASVSGFFLLNFPFGRIFLGDAGAYLCGFLVSALVLVLSARHPGLSPWVPLLIICYPAWEVMVSIHRRLRRKGRRPSEPDRVHLHHLVNRSIARPLSRKLGRQDLTNPLTAIAIWPLPIVTTLVAVNVEMTSVNSLLGIIIFQAFYDRIYRASKIKFSRK